MSYRLHPDAAWLPEDDRVYAMALPDGDFVALEGTAAVIFFHRPCTASKARPTATTA